MPGCPERFFESEEQMECLRCHADCALCTGPGRDDCSACVHPGATLNHGGCVQSCPSRHYTDSLTGKCAGGSNTCKTPVIAFVYLSPSPPPTFSPECHESCLTCAGPHADACTSCKQHHTLDGQGRCVRPASACAPRQYADQDGECHPCHDSCVGCWGPGKSHCLSCTQRHLLLGEWRSDSPGYPQKIPQPPRESLARRHAEHLPLQMAPAYRSARRAITGMSRGRNAERATAPAGRVSERAATSASPARPVCFGRANSAWRPASTGS